MIIINSSCVLLNLYPLLPFTRHVSSILHRIATVIGVVTILADRVSRPPSLSQTQINAPGQASLVVTLTTETTGNVSHMNRL
jgi:hypothetical protein